jgi:hypothetical protein
VPATRHRIDARLMRDAGRALTLGETALVRSMFGDAVDCGAVRLHRARWWRLQPAGVVMAPDGDIWFHPAGLWSDDFSHEPIGRRALLIHEMTHVWQAQRGGRWFLPLMRHPFCRYDYRWAPGRPFERYGLEQQAEIVRHAFLLRQGVAVDGKPNLAIYEALLPFA